MSGKCWKILIFKIIKIRLWSTKMQIHLGQGRSSHRSCYIKVGVLKNFVIFTEYHLCWTLFLIKLQTWRPENLLIQVFSYEYCEVLKTTVLKIILRTELLTRHTNNICFLFLEKCLLPKPNLPSFRFVSIFS